MSTTLDPRSTSATERTGYAVLGGASFAHFLNDSIQSLILAIYPLLKGNYDLSYAQIGIITLVYQLTASLLQPLIGLYTDKRPYPYSLPVGMGFTLTGLLLMSQASSYGVLLAAAALVGTGSSVFHPEASRVARLVSGGRHGFAQSVFQVGGNAGSAAGPVLFVIPHGQASLAWFSALAALAIVVLWHVSRWYAAHLGQAKHSAARAPAVSPYPRRTVMLALAVLGGLMFSKWFYMASMSSYYNFYLIEKFGLSVEAANGYLFVFLLAVAIGTVLGGPIGDRIGTKRVIWMSILGTAPFAMALPYVGLEAAAVLSFIIGIVLASAFPAIVVLAQELVPGKVGAISGLFFGLAFGLGGIAAAVLGAMADTYSIETVFRVCAFLPLLGVLTALLPNPRRA
ncbi:MAG: MFS transporter [Burkholderiaceae bacterium]|nr:MFS transporter [Burkholderiaceae bacterium]